MELKIKLLKWSAGIPVAILNKKTADLIGVKTKGRIFIKPISKTSKGISTIVDIAEKMVKPPEIGISTELKKALSLSKGQNVDVDLAKTTQSLMFIKKKMNRAVLSQFEINSIIKDIVNNSLSEAEIALFVSSMYYIGMNLKETVSLIKAILNTGNSLKLNRNKDIVVDKHSIGGIPGNRTTPIVVAICAAGGLIVPKSSSRAITTSAGTADVIETVAPVDFSMKELENIVRKTHACLIWGGSLGIVPADSKIIQVEKALGLDPEAQLLASIMAKKLSMGAKHILIDIPYGKTAKVDKKKALKLKYKFEKIGKYFNKNLKCVLTKAKEPMGSGVGPALELLDVISVLDPCKKGPEDLEDKSLFLAGELFEMSKKAKKAEGYALAKKILCSGKAFEKFKEIIKAQKGKLDGIKLAKFKKDVLVKKAGKIKEIDNKKINALARVTGCPADKFSGLYIYHNVGTKLKKGDKLITIYSNSKSRLRESLRFFEQEKPIKF